jgi:CRISPR-associated protein Cas2
VKRWIIVTYDIASDTKRARLAKEMLRFGIRTQKSVFECEVGDRELSIIRKIAKRFTESDDLVTVYEVKKVERLGNVEYLEIHDLVF